jgi:hypothetical protein
MLHEETVEARTLALIRRLTADNFLKDFVLVGGTALSLQLGHRKSIDIDLFTAHPFDLKSVGSHVDTVYKGERITVLGNSVFSKIDGIKTDMIAHRYDWIKPVQQIDGIRMASLEDIAAMKLHAIVNSGRRLKDYVDIHFLLENKSLGELTEYYTEKYPDTNAAIAKNALLYHKEINLRADLNLMDREFNWSEVKNRLKAAVMDTRRVFKIKQSPSRDLSNEENRDRSKHLRKGRRI